MLEISVLVLVLQIGFNAALNYRGYNQNPLIPLPRLFNYEQSRRLLSSNRYPLPSRRNPASESDQSDSEDSSLEETSYRRLNPLNSLPYQRQSSLRYNTRTDNDVSLEMAPIGRMNPDNYADVYRPALSDTIQPDMDFRRPYLRNRPTNLRQAQNRKYHRKGDNDLSLEESDRISPLDYTVDSLAAARTGEDASYLRSFLSLIEQPNLRRNQNRKYHRKGDNDLSLEVSPVDGLNSDHDSLNGLPSRRTNLDDTSFLESLLSGLEQQNNRRANLGLEKWLSNKLSLADNNANSNSLRSPQPNLESPNNRRNNRNDNKIAMKNVRLEMQSPEKGIPDAYIDTVLLASGEGKPDDIAIARPQLRNSDKTYVRNNELRSSDNTYVRNNDNYNRRSYDAASVEVSSSNRQNPDTDTSSNLSAFRGLKTRLRSRKPSNNSPNVNKQSNRRDDDNLDLELLLNDRLSPDEDATNNVSFLRLVNLDDLNLDSPQLRSRDQKLKNFRRDDDDDDEILTLSSNDRLSLDDAESAINLAELQSESLDEYNIVSPNLRSREPLYQQNIRRENNDARRELLSNDRLSAEEDTLSDLSVLRLGSLDDLSVGSPLLRSSSSLSRNNNLRTSEADNNKEDLEFLFNDRLSLDDNTPDSLVPYQGLELRSSKPLKNSQNEELDYNRRDNDEVNLDLLSNDRLNHDDNAASDLSVLRLSSLADLNLRSRESLNSNSNNKHTRRDDYGLDLDFPLVNRLNSDNDAAVLLSTNLESPHFRSGIENQPDKQNTDTLQLENPWNDQLSPDNKDSSNLSALRGLRSREKTGSQENEDPKDYDLYLEFPWNDKPTPDDDTKVPKLRSYHTENLDNEQSYLRNRNRNSNYNRRMYNDPNLRVLPLSLRNSEDTSLLESLEDSQMDSKSYLRQSGRNYNENQNLEFLSYAREGLKNDTNIFTNTGDEDVSGIISFPLDRRPHTRHRTQEEDRPQYLNRRANTLLATTTVGPNSTEPLGTSEEVNGTYNDTIIFPAR